MNEIWVNIENYNGKYQVSNYGNVRKLEKNKIRYLFLRKDSGGYLQVAICYNKKKTFYLVHRLVAIAFIPNPYNHKKINHIDKDKTNNNVNNLEWCNRQYNNDYSLSKAVIQLDKNNNFIAEYKSISEASRQTGIDKVHISQCCREIKHYKTAGGYKWKFKNEKGGIKRCCN